MPLPALAEFGLDPQRGFLPSPDPLDRLPAALSQWDQLAYDLPKLLVSSHLRPRLSDLPILDVAALRDEAQWERAMLVLSYFAHAYVWGETPPADRLPAGIAVPFAAVAEHLGRPPVLSYASYALHNWRRIDPAGPIALGNIALLQNFLGGVDEEWFILVHVEIEARAAAAIRSIPLAQEGVAEDRPPQVASALAGIAAALAGMNQVLDRMPERCDPYVYFHRVRPYLYGWKDQPALPQGMLYEGVERFGQQRQHFRGETGAQSAIIPSLDAALGITHRDDPLRTYLLDLRQYLPPRHRAFIDVVAGGPSVRDYVIANRKVAPLRRSYNACIRGVRQFRATHLQYAARYIHRQARSSPANPSNIGTGGTPFMPYLKKHRDEAGQHLIR